jgi:radical SAM protein with 4Fe4S-binding SPASM domain
LTSGIPADEFFPRVLANIEHCAKNSLNTTVNYDLTRPTLPHFLPTVEMICKDLGIRILGIKFFPHGRGFQNRERLEIPYREWHDFLVQVTELAIHDTSFDNLVQISVLCPWELYLPLIREGYAKETIERTWDYKSPLAWERYSECTNLGCDGGVTHCAINADGYLTTCGTIPTLEGLCAGNVMNSSFSKVWENSDVLLRVRNQRLEDIGEPCISCSLKSICGGGCRARAFVLSGSLRGRDPGCPIVEAYLSKREVE